MLSCKQCYSGVKTLLRFFPHSSVFTFPINCTNSFYNPSLTSISVRHWTKDSRKFKVSVVQTQQKIQHMKWMYNRHIFNFGNNKRELLNSKATQPWYFILKQKVPNSTANFVQHFHTSPKHDIHPALWMFIKPFAKGMAILTGRGFRKWWKDLPKHKRLYFLSVLKTNRVKIGVVTAVLLALSIAYYESHIQETPITKRRRFVAFTPDQFEKIADFEFEMQLEAFQSQVLPQTHVACQRVAGVANRLLHSNMDLEQIYDKKWSVTVVNNPTENAFVLPSGQIFVFTGMLRLCINDDELGVVLAHEMAHCVLGHGAEQVSFAHLLDLTVIVVLAAIWAFLPSDGIAAVTHWFFHKVVDILLHLPYNRKLEIEADEVGLQLAAKACFDVRESSAFWSKIGLLKTLQGEVESMDWLSTHPSHTARSVYLDSLMDKALKQRYECGCPSLTRVDPRAQIENFKQKLEEDAAKALAHKQKMVVLVPKSS
ncbi:metalloendopeptidase OMA1, mitochondrial-like [Limulus polyphemus]|uniref:Metalloendopeptidase OMA1, mitochondrial n=1 Tax=Limulus polyphemus TaxID=6850 RepID=A0ABM1B1R4_LIMPO|nr:metalloendopeptidase OMA1, mitochondrial-like [Limulus polyphemus]XP_013773034.1 metalloendopeptidase OMA1, mitochondrial-like [Limulus polyphemus]